MIERRQQIWNKQADNKAPSTKQVSIKSNTAAYKRKSKMVKSKELIKSHTESRNINISTKK
jgi:hypothetical protein